MKRTFYLLALIPLLLFTTACSTEAIGQKDTVEDRMGTLSNQSKAISFLKHVKNQEPDKMRLTTYTVEGDPIYHEFRFDGKRLKVMTDSTHDKFGPKLVKNFTCASDILERENGDHIEFLFTNCDGNTDAVRVFTLPKTAWEQ